MYGAVFCSEDVTFTVVLWAVGEFATCGLVAVDFIPGPV
jgi:hypothetical protein